MEEKVVDWNERLLVGVGSERVEVKVGEGVG